MSAQLKDVRSRINNMRIAVSTRLPGPRPVVRSADQRPTRDLSPLADYPLAREYRWLPPLQDYVRHRPKLGQSGNLGSEVLPPLHPQFERQTPSRYTAENRRAYGRGTVLVLQRTQSPAELENFRVAYVEMTQRPYEKGEFSRLCAKFHYPFAQAYDYVRHQTWYVKRMTGR